MTSRLARWVGRTAQVLIDNHSKGDERCLQGRISQNFVVNFTAPHESLKLGSLVETRIVGHKRHTLVGEPIVG